MTLSHFVEKLDDIREVHFVVQNNVSVKLKQREGDEKNKVF